MKNIKIIYEGIGIRWGFHGGTVVKNPPASEEMRFGPWVKKFPWRRKMATCCIVAAHGIFSLHCSMGDL